MSMWVQVVPVMAAGHGRSRNSCVPHLTENNRAAQSISPISRGPRAILKSGKEASTPSKRSRTRRKAFCPSPLVFENSNAIEISTETLINVSKHHK